MGINITGGAAAAGGSGTFDEPIEVTLIVPGTDVQPGIVLRNQTDASQGVPEQASPALRFIGSRWNEVEEGEGESAPEPVTADIRLTSFIYNEQTYRGILIGDFQDNNVTLGVQRLIVDTLNGINQIAFVSGSVLIETEDGVFEVLNSESNRGKIFTAELATRLLTINQDSGADAIILEADGGASEAEPVKPSPRLLFRGSRWEEGEPTIPIEAEMYLTWANVNGDQFLALQIGSDENQIAIKCGALVANTISQIGFFSFSQGSQFNEISDGVMQLQDSSLNNGAMNLAELRINGLKVVGAQQPNIPEPTGGATVDAEARAAINSILSLLGTHGLMEPPA